MPLPEATMNNLFLVINHSHNIIYPCHCSLLENVNTSWLIIIIATTLYIYYHTKSNFYLSQSVREGLQEVLLSPIPHEKNKSCVKMQ